MVYPNSPGERTSGEGTSPTCPACLLPFHVIQPSNCLLPPPRIRFTIYEVMNSCYMKLVKTVVTITVRIPTKI